MNVLHLLSSLDVFHHARSSTPHEKRQLYGHIYGQDLPAWIIFHSMLGYTLLGIGFIAIVLRFPITSIRQRRWLHPYFGYAWVFGTVWMPVTAIWCVYKFTGWDVIAFFIFSMFAAIQLGWVAIKGYQRSKFEIVAMDSDPTEVRPSWAMRILKILHGTAMMYSFAMLLGAGISFPLRNFEDYDSDYHMNNGTHYP